MVVERIVSVANSWWTYIAAQ